MIIQAVNKIKMKTAILVSPNENISVTLDSPHSIPPLRYATSLSLYAVLIEEP
jgi:hypothetical protein